MKIKEEFHLETFQDVKINRNLRKAGRNFSQKGKAWHKNPLRSFLKHRDDFVQLEMAYKQLNLLLYAALELAESFPVVAHHAKRAKKVILISRISPLKVKKKHPQSEVSSSQSCIDNFSFYSPMKP